MKRAIEMFDIEVKKQEKAGPMVVTILVVIGLLVGTIILLSLG